MHRVFRVRPLVVTEAHNLLLDRFGWQAVRPLLDEASFLFQDIDPELRSSQVTSFRGGRASGTAWLTHSNGSAMPMHATPR
jgi:hypothetical protein